MSYATIFVFRGQTIRLYQEAKFACPLNDSSNPKKNHVYAQNEIETEKSNNDIWKIFFMVLHQKLA